MEIEVRLTETFEKWLADLRDRQARARIIARLARLQIGNFGDVKYFDGIGELRIPYGPGYRLYFVRQGSVVVIMLCGGDKDSQVRDIERAKHMAKKIEV
ncbi:type II toxin-antitoxin system RelE/ParE family toxin [Ferrovibrio sp.]|uniref:type II toxin-antitoxin system RelE/ParE family toxin n=1 Tax=Ferrovibrio sp. TaxID=1917215 RepID=UPI003D137CF2